MTDPTDEYEITYSPLSGDFRRDGTTVEVLIYQGEDDDGWILEVVDQENASYLWDDKFPTDELAMREFLASVEKSGMKQFNPYYRH